MTYNPICYQKELIIGNNSHVAILTGWIPKEKITRMLTPDQYAVIGQLYNVSGIDPLVRNLLANPEIDTIILIYDKREKNSGINLEVENVRQALVNLFPHLDTDHNPVFPEYYSRSCVKNDIPDDVLIDLYRGVDFQIFEISEFKDEFIDYINNTIVDHVQFGDVLCTEKRKAKIYALPEPIKSTTVQNTHNHTFFSRYIDTAWGEVLHRVLNNGQVTDRFTELHDVNVHLINPEYSNEWVELCVDNESPFTNDQYVNYASSLYTNLPTESDYSYGQRVEPHLSTVLDRLVTQPENTQCTVSIWQNTDYDLKSPPCLNLIHFRIVDGELTLSAFFRSHDAYGGWLMNVHALSCLQSWMVRRLNEREMNLNCGWINVHSRTLHIYPNRIEDAKKWSKHVIEYDDPIGYFVVYWNDSVVEVRCYDSVRREETMTFTGKGESLLKKIDTVFPNLSGYHALYLGREITRCEREKNEYVQDRS
jgi:thymidylate synthase